MGNLRNVVIAENRIYDDPQNPANSAYDVALPITVPDAVIDPSTGKNLSATLSEQTAAIVAAKEAAESASNAVGNLSEHNHDDRYYTETEVNNLLAGKAASSHSHTATQISGLPTSLPANGGNADTVDGKHAADFAAANHTHGYAAASHTHDDRYYTESEINTKLSGKANSSHTHTAAQISGLPTSLPANGGNADTVDGVHVVTTAALGLHRLASGTAAATTANCPAGCWYGQH